MYRKFSVLVIAATLLMANALAVQAEPQGTGPTEGSAKATSKPISIYSHGVKMAGDLWTPPGATTSDKRPAILMMHGFGGLKDELNRTYAPIFAANGYYVLTFDYRGFGMSNGDLLPVGDLATDRGKIFTTKVREVRNVVSAIHQYDDIRSALLYLKGDPGVDGDRIAVWGTSLGGGLALKTAINHPEIKVLINQIGAVNMMPFYTRLPATSPGHPDNISKWHSAIARGEAPFLPGEKSWIKFSEHHQGYADSAANFLHEPMRNVETLRAATLIIDAEKEELFDTTEQGALLYGKIKGQTKASYEVLPGSHFDQYEGEGAAAAIALQLAWLKKHLPVE